ncbi:hydroxylysine kinase [Orussus abietinus]|uniref:hydroxylysine kinase n=1 Tax=Orussus abietinus TaxID=222816 RepID=UPI000626975A|nr:hydroxylysine kinase [Orussus abietinus]
MSEGIYIKHGQCIRPNIDVSAAKSIVESLYGLKVEKVEELNAYYDKVYHVECRSDYKNPYIECLNPGGYVLKVLNVLDSRNETFIEAQGEVMKFLNEREIVCPSPVKNLKNAYYSLETLGTSSGEKNLIWLLVYRPGTLLSRVNLTTDLLYQVGHLAARIDSLLLGFSHLGYSSRRTLWMLTSVPKLQGLTFAISDPERKRLACEVIERFEKEVLERLDKLAGGIIHGDLNENNILMNKDEKKIAAIIDFQDSQRSYLIFELAIAVCHMIHQTRDVSAGRHVIDGYRSVRTLPEFEKSILKITVCARFAQCLITGAYTHLNDPANAYIFEMQKTGWTTFQALYSIDGSEVLRLWGLAPS